MGRRTAMRVGLAALLLAASAACSSSPDDLAGPTATVGTEPPTTATTNPYAVPPVIDAAYVNRVLAGLDAVTGDVTRLVIRTRTIPREAYDRLKAVYADPAFLQLKIDGYQRDIREGFAGYRADPGNKRSTVTQTITTLPSCIFVRVNRDYSSVGTNPLSDLDTQWVALKPLDVAHDPNRYNPTPWAFIYDGLPRDRSQPPNPCEK